MILVGIAGGTAGGKSTFAKKLEKGLMDRRVCVIHMDSFFKAKDKRPHVPSHINGKYYIDDNCPDTIDWQSYHRAIDAAEEEYDIIILEGLLVLWDDYTKDRLNFRLFVDCNADERIVRRIRRNQKWGQNFEEICDVYLNMVRFRHDAYVEPTKWTADLIINGAGNTDIAAEMCIQKIRSMT